MKTNTTIMNPLSLKINFQQLKGLILSLSGKKKLELAKLLDNKKTVLATINPQELEKTKNIIAIGGDAVSDSEKYYE